MTATSRQTRPHRVRTRTGTNASAVVEGVLQIAASRLFDASNGDLSAKALHDLRIACRRAEAALRLCRDAADGRAWQWLKRHLKTLRNACNDARDDDVLCKWVKRHGTSSSKSVQQVIRAHRQSLQPRITELAQRLSEQDRFGRRSRQLIKRLRSCERQGQVAQTFGQRLFDEVYHFVKSLPVRRDEAAALHRLRIAGKRLRYASELVTEIWPDVELTELKEHLQSLQSRLGKFHDQLVGVRRLRKRTLRLAARDIRPLVRISQEKATQLQRRFWRWWPATPLERMLADTTAEAVTVMNKSP